MSGEQGRRGRVFFSRFTEDAQSDGRHLLNVELEDRDTGKTYRWCPPWHAIIELMGRAVAIEEANKARSLFTPLLKEARRMGHKSLSRQNRGSHR